ncbi:hypothetical protein TNCV_3628441 [Trichonephila clavipes]|nr:hypothetical protein TNCV_3628441 [Trichonephila clavipes]
MNKTRKIPAGLKGSNVSSEKFVEVNHNSTELIMTDDIFVQSLKNIGRFQRLDPVSTSSEMRNAMKSMRSYLDAQSNGEMNNEMDDSEQRVDKLMLKEQCKEKYQIIF